MLTKKYVIALDQGTTSSRAIVFDHGGNIIATDSMAHAQIYPQPGYVEHDPLEIIACQLSVLKNVVKKADIEACEIDSIGITNQRETVVVWDRATGAPIHNAIVWQCRRTATICEYVKNQGMEKTIQKKTGLVVDAYFSGTKIKWILDNVEGARARAIRGELCAGTIDTWLIYNLTHGKTFVTDYSNASRTMLYNIRTLEWDSELLKLFEIPESMLPQVVPSSGYVCDISADILGESVPIFGIAGDQQAALFGQTCFEVGDVKNTYGTGCFILMNTGHQPKFSSRYLLTTIAWGMNGRVTYALEGSVFNAGSTIKWLVEQVKLAASPQQASEMAERVGGCGGVCVVPAFTGLGAPYWDMYARGTIIGLTRGSTNEHIVRATLESIAYQSRGVIEVMGQELGSPIKSINVDGGVSSSDFVMQFQADIAGVLVKKPKIIETTALGAAYLAGLGSGFWKSKSEILSQHEIVKTYMPEMQIEDRELAYAQWQRAAERSRGWEA